MDTSKTSYDNYFKVTRCNHTNLLVFHTFEEIQAFQTTNCGEHRHPILKVWRCNSCHCLHYWSIGHDPNSVGKFKAGTKIPEHVFELIQGQEFAAARAAALAPFEWYGPLELRPKSMNGKAWFRENLKWATYKFQ